MKAMILAAGFGKRMHPVTRSFPKPLIPVFSAPIITRNLLLLKRQGIEDVIINLHHLPDPIVEHLGDGESLGIKISYSYEKEILGTAGGIKKVEKELRGDTFLVMNADTYRTFELSDLLQRREKGDALATLLLKKNPALPRNKAVRFDTKTERVTGYPTIDEGTAGGDEGKTGEAVHCDFLGVQLMEPEVFDRIPQGVPFEMVALYERIFRDKKGIAGFLTDDYWKDLGTLENYCRIHEDALDGRFDIHLPGSTIARGIRAGEGLDMSKSAKVVPPVFMGSGCRIGPGVTVGPYAVLGNGCVVEKGGRVVRSILWDRVRVAENETVRNKLVGPDVTCDLDFWTKRE